MNFGTALREECVLAGSEATDKEEMLREIARLAKRSPLLDSFDEQALYRALDDRETAGSTAFGGAMAIPHCRLAGLTEFVVGIVTHKSGLAFGARDGEPVRVFVFIVGPAEKRSEHIQLLASVSRVLSTGKVVEHLSSKGDSASLCAELLSHTVVVGKLDEHKKCLFRIAIQDESLFTVLLQLLSEIDGTSISVVEAHSASSYLDRLPLFAGFLGDRAERCHRIILATVRHVLANEVLRQISNAAGDLSSVKGLVVTVQELSYCAGALNV